MLRTWTLQEKRDLVTGLKSRTIAGRPNWNKVFTQIREQRKGRITVFYCGKTRIQELWNQKFISNYQLKFFPPYFSGNPILAKVLRQKCDEFGFQFRKEVFWLNDDGEF